ncbi:MAG: DUF5312 domain-containing protein [Treponema sp.]|jgi:hypothetical protein|nr:DUF5312 domain-containing protein [Treponema sp.]
MAVSGTFIQLVSGMSMEERRNLLEKLSSQSNISKDPLYVEDEGQESSIQIEERYARLPWYYHIWYVLLSVFKARQPVKLFEEHQIANLGKHIESIAPGMFNYRRNILLPLFHRALNDLKSSARFFFNALDASVSRDKGAFYAFLGSLEMEDIHRRLLTEIDPVSIAQGNPVASESELRSAALHALEDILTTLTNEQKQAMYYDARSLFCLKELAGFLFDRLIMSFAFDPTANGEICSANLVKEQLASLNNILFSIQEPPPLSLLESMFIFVLQEHKGEQGFEMGKEIRTLLSRTEDALVAIREFNKQVPLTLILRYANRDISIQPKRISGGEDWFIVYRDYWKQTVESLFSDYIKKRRRQELMNSFRYFLKGNNLKILTNAVSESNPDGFPISSSFNLSFLLTFYSAIFMPEINKILRRILIEGEFFRKENRTEFTENYNELIKMEEYIKTFEAKIAPDGELGRRFDMARADMSSLPVKRRKIQLITEDAASQAVNIVETMRRAMSSMIKVLEGIIKKESDVRYDTLINLKSFTKSGNFIPGIVESIQKFQKALQILNDIEAMEAEK